jgi:quinol monooxygenase YgiN
MIIGRFKAQSRPEWTERVAAAMTAVEAPSRELPGVVHFDVSRSLTDPHSFVATEVFEDRTALDLQNAQAEVAALLALVDQGALARDYEWTVWEAPGEDAVP